MIAEVKEDELNPRTRPQGASQIATANENLDVEFGDESLMQKGDGFDRICPPQNDKSKVARVNMLTDVVGPKQAYIHFITGKGPIRCVSKHDPKGNITEQGFCCKRLNQPEPNHRQNDQLVVVVLAFWYKNAGPNDGRYAKTDPPPPIQWEIGWIKLSRSGYRKVSNLIEEDRKPHEFDLLISHKEGFGYEYTVIASRSRFRMNQELVAEVMEAAKPYRDGQALIKKLGRHVTELELLSLIQAAPGATSAANAKVTDSSDI